MTIKTHELSQLEIRGDIRLDTFNEENRTVTVIASTGARVMNVPFFSEPYHQELDMGKEAVDLRRFENGAPILDNHKRDGSLAEKPVVLGVIENARIENGNLVHDVRFSKRAELEPFIQDVKDGIIRNVSIGFKILQNDELKDRAPDGYRIFRATKWEPMETSFVPIGADAGSVTRNADHKHVCNFVLRGEEMAEKKDQAPQKSEVNLDDVRAEAIKAERERTEEIRKSCSGLAIERDFVDGLIDRGLSADEARKEVLGHLAQLDKKLDTKNTRAEVGEDLSREGVKKGITEAILNRCDHNNELSEQSRKYAHRSLVNLASDWLEVEGKSTRGMTPNEIATRALHSTSDFPYLLADVTKKSLRRAYEESPQSFAPFTRRVSTPDFKPIYRTQLGDGPSLQKKLENGEYTAGTIGEAQESYSVEEYGKILPIGRRVLVNDDLDAFSRVPAIMGRRARDLESDLVWAVITSNPTMGDGVALFNAAHGNLGSAGALSETTLTEARKLMRLQTGLGGAKLNLIPRYLAVPVALETSAEKILTGVTPNQTSQVNVFGPGGTTPMMALVEPRLDDTSATEHYVFADQSQVDIIELATLEGESAPVLDSMIDFYTDGVKFKIRHTIGVKAIDWRGIVKLPG